MTENEFLLQDRITKIQSVMKQYGEENFYISFSGGKDSCVLSKLVDLALPDNKIPRVYADTGIEFNAVRDFVIDMQKYDDRVKIIKPTVPIKKMLEEKGYPFKSKGHSEMVERYKRIGKSKGILQYLGERTDKEPWSSYKSCPKILKYQFTPEFKMNISDKCCEELKEKPLDNWRKDNNRPYSIVGLMREEGGRRSNAACMAFRQNKLKAFQPLVVLTKEWEDWFIKAYDVAIPALYYPPFNFPRTGCKGCPFNARLSHELNILQQYFPAERKQCEAIWKPVYDEYRRIGYRLKKKDEYHQVTIDEII